MYMLELHDLVDLIDLCKLCSFLLENRAADNHHLMGGNKIVLVRHIGNNQQYYLASCQAYYAHTLLLKILSYIHSYLALHKTQFHDAK